MPKDLELPVDTRINLGLHPQSVASLEEYDDDTEGDLRQVVDAFVQSYDVVGKVHATRAAVEQDINLTPPMRVLATSDAANKVLERATRAFDKASANMRSGIANIEKELTAPVQARAAQTIATEIRAHIKGTKSPVDFVMAAIRNGDHDSVNAALGAPAYLSGLEPAMQATLTRMYHEAHNPVAAKRLRAMRAAADLLDQRGGLILAGIEQAVGVYEDPKSKRKYHPQELRAMRDKSTQAFTKLGG